MEQYLLNIIYTVLGTALTTLVSWLTAKIISWLNSKIKNEKANKFVTDITLIVTSAVQSIFQQFVESLKTQGKFNEEAQKQAKEKALAIINNQLTPELKQYIQDNFGDIQKWLSEQIEATIYKLKNNI